MTEILWAGWRSSYVKGVDAGEGECLFCRLPELPDDEALMLERGQKAFTVLNRFPYSPGHLMIGPYRHVATLADLKGDERQELWDLLVRAQQACDRIMAPHGYNLGTNLGRVAGAGVPGHLHFHLVPRWEGDTNFMTTIGGTRVLPEDLVDTWTGLRSALQDDS